jgi:hypothetical protein
LDRARAIRTAPPVGSRKKFWSGWLNVHAVKSDETWEVDERKLSNLS